MSESEATRYAEEVVDRLILVNRLDEVSLVLRQESQVGGSSVLEVIDRRADSAAVAGRPNEAAFLRFLRPFVEQALPEWARVPGVGTSLSDLIAATVALPHLLEMFLHVRRTPAIRTPEALTRVRVMMADPETPAALKDRYASLYALLGLFSDRPDLRVESRASWTTVLRHRGNLTRALFHARRAGAEATGDMRLAVQGALAAVQGQAGDLVGRVATLTAAIAEAEPGIPLVSLHRSVARDLRQMGRSRDALDHVSAALALLPDDLASDEPRFTLTNLRGLLYEDNGDYERGAAEYQDAIAIAKRMGHRGHEFEARTNNAASLMKSRRNHAGLRAFHKIHQLTLLWGAPNLIAAAKNNLGHAELMADNLTAAAEHYGAVLAMRPDEDSVGVANNLFGLGDILERRGSIESAATTYRMALMTAAAAGAEEHAAMMFASRAAIGGDDDEETEGLLRDMFDRGRTTQRWMLWWQAGVGLAEYLAPRGRRAEALALLRGLLVEADQREATLHGIHLRQIKARLLAESPDDTQEAFDALWTARAAVLVLVDQAADPGRRAEIAAEFIDLYEALISLLVSVEDGEGDHTRILQVPGGDPPEELAYNLHEEARSRSFLAALADAPLSMPDTVPADLAVRENDLLNRRQELHDGLSVLVGYARRTRLSEINDLAGQLAEVYAAISLYAPEYARMRQGRPATLAVVRDLLTRHAPNEGAVVVSYFCGRQATFCFAVTSGDGALMVYRVPLTSTDLTSVVDRLRTTFNGDSRAFPPLAPLHPRRPSRRNLDFLDNVGPQLLAFVDLVDGRPLVCIVPHGPLHLVPMHALPDATGTKIFRRVAVTYAPSLSLLAHVLARPPVVPASALVAGVAAREDPEPTVLERDSHILRSAGWKVTEIEGPAATRQATLTAMSHHDIAHITCHGYIDPRSPLESGLLLANDAGRPTKFVNEMSIVQRHEAVLRAQDLAAAQMSVRLLTMRACSSAWQVAEHAGDEFSGLNRALLRAGVAATISALWNVDQHSSADLLRDLYRAWLDGEPLWRSLWRAQQTLASDLSQPWCGHPYHWAALILVGDWR